jgi:putative spermidine/putrescine transport system ATP-binding protein
VTTDIADALHTGRHERSGAAVRLADLHRSYGAVRALNGLSLEIAPGEFVALLGPSGCGKTTALRALAGLDEVDAGQIVVDDRDITRLSANRRDMGMVFQAYSLFPTMTARDNVAYGLRLRGVDARTRRRRAEDLLELVGLASHAAHYPHQLSGGQQQRVALARALAVRPKVLLLDEPLSALDAKVRSQLRDEIRRIQLEVGITTLFVTHDQEEALAVADRVGVIHSGRLEQIASPGDLYDRPRTAFVAEFVGLSNRLKGKARSGEVNLLGTPIPLLPGSTSDGQVTAFIRPESVLVDREPGQEPNGRVLAVSFLGSLCRVRIQLADQGPVLAQMSTAQAAHLVPGTPVQVTLRTAPVFAHPA